MQKYEWRVRAVDAQKDLESFAANLETNLNSLEKDGFEVQKMEIKDKGILLTGRRPARRTA
jgi:hypothetical protein